MMFTNKTDKGNLYTVDSQGTPEHSEGAVAKYKSAKMNLQGVKQWSSSIQLSDGLPWGRDEGNT